MFKGRPVWTVESSDSLHAMETSACVLLWPALHTHTLTPSVERVWQMNCIICKHSVAGDYHSFNVNGVHLTSFASSVLLARYVECTVCVHDAFRPNKRPWIFNQGAAVWLSALQTVNIPVYLSLDLLPHCVYRNILALRLFQLFTLRPLARADLF